MVTPLLTCLRRPHRLLAGWASLALAVIVAAACGSPEEGDLDGVRLLRSAIAAQGDGPAFPAVPVPVRAVSLPDNWATTRPDYQGTLWYRIELDRPPARGTSRCSTPTLTSAAAACSVRPRTRSTGRRRGRWH